MKNKKWMALFVALTMILSGVGVGLSTDVASAATNAPKKLYLKATSKTVDIKGKVTVSVESVSPKSASKSVKWKSSNKRIATVSSKGVVTGKRAGKVKITATSKKSKRVKKTITIRVKNVKPKVALPSKATTYTGLKATLKAKVGPAGVYNRGVTYRSSNTKVATVSSKGVVTAKKKGTTTITAYSKESKRYKDTCKVTVRQSITGLKFKTLSLEMKNGTTTNNGLTVTPSNPFSKEVTYTSSNPQTAMVDSKGVVKAVAPGTTTIKATAKYGVKKTATYSVTVYDILTPENGTYTLDERKYGSYRISAVKDGQTETLQLTNADLNNVFGYGNIGFDWRNARAVENNFADASFSYISGGDYIFEKKDSKVTIKLGKDTARTVWYYMEGKSYDDKGKAENDYSITLFQNPDGSGDTIVLNKVGNALAADRYGKSIKIEESGDKVTLTVNSGSKTLTAVFEYVDKYTYRATFAARQLDKYKVEVKAYK